MIRMLAATLACAFVIVGAPAEARDYTVVLTYVAPASVQQGAPAIVLAPITDSRGHGPNWLGAIRGGYGNPLKVLVTEQPVAEVVAQAIRDGLAARNMATENGAYRLVVDIKRFNCNQLFPKEAHINLSFRLEDASTGAVRFESTVSYGEAGPGMGGGIFTPVEPLRALTNKVLQTGVDMMLDDPAFRVALGQQQASLGAGAAPAATTTAPDSATGATMDTLPAPLVAAP